MKILFENWSTIGEVIVKIKVAHRFFEIRGICMYIAYCVKDAIMRSRRRCYSTVEQTRMFPGRVEIDHAESQSCRSHVASQLLREKDYASDWLIGWSMFNGIFSTNQARI